MHTKSYIEHIKQRDVEDTTSKFKEEKEKKVERCRWVTCRSYKNNFFD
jgi:hypothetical protein